MKVRVYKPGRLVTALIFLALGVLSYPDRNLNIGFGQPYHHYVWLAFVVGGLLSAAAAFQPPKKSRFVNYVIVNL